MRLIDRYLLRQFLQIFLICFCSLTGLYIVIDAFGNLDRFLSAGEDQGNLIGRLVEFYIYRSVTFFDWTSGILAMITAMFTVTWLERHRELTALLAAGIPKFRIMLPVILAGLGVSILAASGREFVIPQIRDQLASQGGGVSDDDPQPLESSFDNETEIMFGGESTIRRHRQIVEPTLVLPAALDKYGANLVADSAAYQPPAPGQFGGYLLSGVRRPQDITELPTLKLDGRPIVITPRDADWLARDQVFVVSGLTFDILAAGSTWREYASTAELIGELSRPSADPGDGVRVAVHRRVMQPFLDMTLLMLGLPLVVSRSNRNMFLAIGMCLVIVTAFMLVVIGCQSLGTGGWMRPALSVWLPLLVFAPIVAWTSDSLYL